MALIVALIRGQGARGVANCNIQEVVERSKSKLVVFFPDFLFLGERLEILTWREFFVFFEFPLPRPPA